MKETVAEFYTHRSIDAGQNLNGLRYGVYELEKKGFAEKRPATYCRRDFYKVALIRGENRCHYADKSIYLTGSNLLFFSPHIPYTWEPLSDETGYFCIFSEDFFAEGSRKDLKLLPMFALGGKPAYSLTSDMDNFISSLFQKMLSEDIRAAYYQDISRAYLNEIIYKSLCWQPTEKLYTGSNASVRLTDVFFEVLNREFNTGSTHLTAPMRSASQYADFINVHTNHLNNIIKQTTGKTTSEHIFERLSVEAQTLLRNTNLTVSEISYRLGYQEPAHFFHFFRKKNGVSPSEYRKQLPGQGNTQ